jgi:hypothetical protein
MAGELKRRAYEPLPYLFSFISSTTSLCTVSDTIIKSVIMMAKLRLTCSPPPTLSQGVSDSSVRIVTSIQLHSDE